MKKIKKKDLIMYILIPILGALLLLGPDIFLNHMANNATLIGEKGLQTAFYMVLVAILNKIIKAVFIGIMISIFVSFIESTVGLYKLRKKINVPNDIENESEKIVNKKMVNIKIVLIVILIVFIFMPEGTFYYNNKESMDEFKIGNEITTLYNIIKDLKELETYKIEASDYKVTYVKSIHKSSYRSGGTSTLTRDAWYVKFDNHNYIAITEKDKDIIESYMNTYTGKNIVTLFKNTGLICNINEKKEYVSNNKENEKEKIQEIKNLMKITIDKNGKLKRSKESDWIKENYFGMCWEIYCDGKLALQRSCENETEYSIKRAVKSGKKYSIKITAFSNKDKKRYQISNEVEYEKE